MPSSHLILCHPLLLLPSIFHSIRVFSNESALHIRWPKDWSSASPSVLSMNIQGWFPSGLTGLTSLLLKGLSRVFSSTTIGKHQLFSTLPSLWSNSHIHALIQFKIFDTVCGPRKHNLRMILWKCTADTHKDSSDPTPGFSVVLVPLKMLQHQID